MSLMLDKFTAVFMPQAVKNPTSLDELPALHMPRTKSLFV